MPPFTGLYTAIMCDVLFRVSLVLTGGLLLALAARRNAAFRHAILFAALAGALIVPAAMLAARMLPVSRLQLDLLGQAQLDNFGPVAVANSQPPSVLHLRAASLDHAAATIVSTRRDAARQSPGANGPARLNQWYLEPRATNSMNTPGLRFMASAVIWVLVFVAIVKVTGLGISLLRLRRIVARARPVTSNQVLAVLKLIQERIPRRHVPCLLESTDVSAPVAAGVIGDFILLPMGWAGSLRHDELLAVLCHECAHLARRDHYVVIVQELFASALWFHPLVHLFNRTLNRVREEVCDNYAIALVERPTYCEALLHLAVGGPGKSVRGATSMWTRQWPLEHRIRGILDQERLTKTGISSFTRAATAALTVAICGLIAMPQLTAAPLAVQIQTKAGFDTSSRAEAGQVVNELTKTMTRSFPVRGKQVLRLENLAGRVELLPGKGNMVEVEAIVRVGDLSAADVKRLIDDIQWIEAPTADGEPRWGLGFTGGRYGSVRYPVAGETKTDSTIVRHLDREIRLVNHKGESVPSVEFDLRISLPLEAHIAVRNIVGPIEGHNLEAPLDVTTHHGVIKLEDVRAPTNATSELGDILISRLNGDAVLRTESGNIELRQVSGGQVALSTRSGDCRILEPPDTGFQLQYSGIRPIRVTGGGVRSISTLADNRRVELLSRGIGGPKFSVTAGTGETAIEAVP
jgi:beta-lactamase regulating signal transducer with metallopeptidase domain